MESLQIAERLYRLAGAVYYFDERDILIAQIAGLKYCVHTAQVMQILDEVYIEGMYNIDVATPVVVVDIGMNVGIASLFIAKNMKASVFAFEPFCETYQAALSNFALNADVSDLIRPHNFGIGTASASIETLYCPEASGDCGIIPIPQEYCQGRKTKTEIIKLKPISDIFDLIRNDFPEKGIVLKIDCEGSEYEIVQSLYRSDRLKYVEIIMLEWHRRSTMHDPSIIVEILINSGFNLLKRGSLAAPVGMLYAFRATH
jgi:FkbM family methyltransferase